MGLCFPPAPSFFPSSQAKGAPAASAPAPRLHTTHLRSQVAAAYQTWRKHRGESGEWLVERTVRKRFNAERTEIEAQRAQRRLEASVPQGPRIYSETMSSW